MRNVRCPRRSSMLSPKIHRYHMFAIREIVMTGVVRDGMLSLKGIMLFNSAFRRRAQAIRGSASVYSAICRNAFAVLLVVACGLPVQWASGADPKQVYQESSDALYN